MLPLNGYSATSHGLRKKRLRRSLGKSGTCADLGSRTAEFRSQIKRKSDFKFRQTNITKFFSCSVNNASPLYTINFNHCLPFGGQSILWGEVFAILRVNAFFDGAHQVIQFVVNTVREPRW